MLLAYLLIYSYSHLLIDCLPNTCIQQFELSYMWKKKSYTDHELVQGCANNDRKYQELLYRRYFRSMMYMCMKHTADRDLAMQIVNNGFLRVFKKIDTYAFKGSLEGWIRRIVFHSISDFYKKHSKYVQFLVFEEKEEKIPEEALEKMYAEDILNMVNTLPPATKKVFQLYAIEGYTHKEIGVQLQISEGTSKWHLSAARKALKKMLNNQSSSNKYHAG